MRNLFLSPRLPRGPAGLRFAVLTGAITCVVCLSVISTAIFFLAVGLDLTQHEALLVGAVGVVVQGTHVFYRTSRYTFFNATEMALGLVVIFLATGVGAYYLIPLGFLIYMKPYSDGPEPRGWLPHLERQVLKEKLKSRRS